MAGGIVSDTFTITNVSYSGTTLSMTIASTYGMKNPHFTVGSDSDNVEVDRSGYLQNPYDFTLTGISLTAGKSYSINADYMDNTDSGTSVYGSGTFAVPGSDPTPASASSVVQLVDNKSEKIYPVGISELSKNAEWFTVTLEGNQKTTVTSKNGNEYEFTPWDGSFGDGLAAGWYMSSGPDNRLFAEVTTQLEVLNSGDTTGVSLYLLGCLSGERAYNRCLGRRSFNGSWVAPYAEHVDPTSKLFPFRDFPGSKRSYPGTYVLSYSVLPCGFTVNTWVFQGKISGLVYDGSTPMFYSENFDFEIHSDSFMPALALGFGSSHKKSTCKTTYRILERK